MVRDLERQLAREPGNLTVRVTLAAAYRELGRTVESVEQYRAVAGAYLHEGRADEAMAACASGLAMAPDDRELRALDERARAVRTMPVKPPVKAGGAGSGAAGSGAAGPMTGPIVPPAANASGPVVAPVAMRAAERSASASGTDLETPLPPPMALHDSIDSLVGLPVGVSTSEETRELSLPPVPPPSSAPVSGRTLLGPAASSGAPASGSLPRLPRLS
ncbi:MAG TPA: hypothetical protein VHE35_15090, partial [Kofleriaceae bacterium]|nr:hypothetical protein [Kofleriaceae bacterium]